MPRANPTNHVAEMRSYYAYHAPEHAPTKMTESAQKKLSRQNGARKNYSDFETKDQSRRNGHIALENPKNLDKLNGHHLHAQKLETLEGTVPSTRRSLVLLVIIFLMSLSALVLVYTTFPELEESEIQYVKLPRDIEDAKNLGKVLSHYKEKFYYQVLGGVFVTYIFLQSFAIPGSIFLSILSGFLFPFPLALFLICTCSAIGASLCFFLSALVGRRLLLKFAGERIKGWAATVEKNSEHMLNYIVFLRITPILPNWFINLTAPLLGVQLWPFFMGTFLGVAPPSFVAINAGTTLQKLTSSSDALSFSSVAILCILAVLSVVPVLLKNKLKSKFE